MHVLLIQPAGPDPLMNQVYLFEPLALEYLGAGLKNAGHQVTIHDARIEPDWEETFRRLSPDVVGITGFTSQLNIMKAIAERIREIAPGTFIVVGGHHATVRPGDFAASTVNVAVVGEGVSTLCELLERRRSGLPLSDVRGVALPSPVGMQLTPPRPYTPLDELPFPDRSLTARYRSRYFSEWFRPLASVRTSLGCTARCTFCALWSITGGKYLRRAPERVVEELAEIPERNVFFCDDESMCDVKRMDRLADLITQAGIRKKYFLYARADTIVANPELFAKWARIGLSQVFVGMEDFSDRRLAAMKKGVTTRHQAEAAAILERLGVMMYGSFMIDPDYGRDDFAALKQYIRDLKLRYATFTVMTPLPGTELHESVKERLLSEKPELYDMLHALVPTRLPLPEFYDELAKLYAGAIPLGKSLPTLLRFGLHGMLLRIRLFGKFLDKMRLAHLDY